MSDYPLNDDIREIIISHLKIESKVVAIDSLFMESRLRKRINYEPYYQRKYVWEKEKATYFLESILLGTEIPPFVFFNSGAPIEVIDGRQRFESIDRFLTETHKFSLSEKGLYRLKLFSKKTYNELDQFVRDIFLDTKLRVIEFSVINEPRLSEKQEDLIKKEIFRRYNSGITPLRSSEIERAIYTHDDLTHQFKVAFSRDKKFYGDTLGILALSKDGSELEDNRALSEALRRIRQLLILPSVPIYYYSRNRSEVFARLYELFANNAYQKETEVIKDFRKKVKILNRLKADFPSEDIHRYLFECLYWLLCVLEKEGQAINSILDADVRRQLVEHINGNYSHFQTATNYFYQDVNNRYDIIVKFVSNVLNKNLTSYLSGDGQYNPATVLQSSESINMLSDFEILRLNKPDAQSSTIDDIHRQINRNRFLIRPVYQREEVINRKKSSAIIESMLLGIKLPPIFVYKRDNGVFEVIDGQQRLLSIIGYIGYQYKNENGEESRSKKHEFALADLSIMKDLNGKRFKELGEELQNRIYDFNLSLVTIDAKLNPKFDPIDLFLRLNNKPYPIRDHSFEMWNSYIAKDIITKIKSKVEKQQFWFHLRVDNRRMENEELYTTLAYLEYQTKVAHDDPFTLLHVYARGVRINSRIVRKGAVTKLLRVVSENEPDFRKFLEALKNVDSFISKVRLIVLDKNADDNYLKNELNAMFQAQTVRTSNMFYILWLILHKIDESMIREHRTILKNEITALMTFIKDTTPLKAEVQADGLELFKAQVYELWSRFQKNKRELRLSREEREALVTMQNNTCPLCGQILYIGDEIHIDHIEPLGIGGLDESDNLQAVHRTCNLKKGVRRGQGKLFD